MEDGARLAPPRAAHVSLASQRVHELFEAALAVAPERRPRFVRAQAADDTELAAEVLSLLEHDSRAEGDRFLDLSPSLAAGEKVGPYRVIRKLGTGGMGEVYLIEQDAPLERSLALKLIKLGMDSRAIVARFDIERRVLARMDHPAIARVFDAGITERGQPWFVMEYVDGLPIDEHCRGTHAAREEIIRLVLEVCEAVEHAHQKAVIHRDLKPSNILITSRNGRSHPKIIDFGLARATEPGGSSELTRVGEILGTPEFMSPEQRSGEVDDVDTRSDVYALGAVLDRLVRPASPEGRAGTHAELPAELPADLAAIVATAMAEDRDLRYASVAALADDLRRFAEGRPVLARAPTAIYRLRKYCARHRAWVILTSVAALAVLLASVGTGFALAEARAARVEASDTLDSFHLLAFGVELRRALAEEQSLYPPWPEQIPRMRQWLEEFATPLTAKSETVWRSLGEIRGRALPYDEAMRTKDESRKSSARDELAMLERRRHAAVQGEGNPAEIASVDARITDLKQRISQPGVFAFADPIDHVTHDALAQLIGELLPFMEPRHGVVARVRERLEWAESVERVTIDAHRASWERAADTLLADVRTRRIALEPQIGMIPLGLDRRRELLVFEHAWSGIRFMLVPDGESAFLCSLSPLTEGEWNRLRRLRHPPAESPETRPFLPRDWRTCSGHLRQHGMRLPRRDEWLRLRQYDPSQIPAGLAEWSREGESLGARPGTRPLAHVIRAVRPLAAR